MEHVLVSIIGDQTAPNLFLIQDEAFQHINRYLFITTVQMEAQHKLEHLLLALGIVRNQYQKIIVSPDQLDNLTKLLEMLNLDAEQTTYYVNITSGTKIMSIGTFAFFSRPIFHALIYYVPVGQPYYWQLSNGFNYQRCPFRLQTGMSAYLTSYGLQILPTLYTGTFLDSKLPQQFFNYYTDEASTDHFKSGTYKIRTAYDHRAQNPIDLTGQVSIKAFLDHIDFPLEQEDQLSPKEAQFLIGGWLETYIYQQLLEHLSITENEILERIEIFRVEEGDNSIKNEFDIIFLYQQTLYIVECKTGLGKKNPEIRKQLEPTYNQLKAHRTIFGMNVRMALITMSQSLRKEKDGSFKAPIAERLNDPHVVVIDYPVLSQAPSVWISHLLGE